MRGDDWVPVVFGGLWLCYYGFLAFTVVTGYPPFYDGPRHFEVADDQG